jgi:hypothetical protein
MVVIAYKLASRYSPRRIAGGRLISTQTVRDGSLPSARSILTVPQDIGEELRAALMEEYSNQKKSTDGEVYRKIRQYEGEGNEAFRERWFVRLSPSNQERLDQLDNKKNRRLRHAFDRLLTIPGLWPGGMRISLLHRLIASGCVEVSFRLKLLSFAG